MWQDLGHCLVSLRTGMQLYLFVDEGLIVAMTEKMSILVLVTMATAEVRLTTLLSILYFGNVFAVVADNHHENHQSFPQCSVVGCRCLSTVDRQSCDWCDAGGRPMADHTRGVGLDTKRCHNAIKRLDQAATSHSVDCRNSSRDQKLAIDAISCVDAGLGSFPVALLESDSSLFFLDLRHNALVRLNSVSVPLSTASRWTVVHLRVADNMIHRININSPWSRSLRTLDLSGNQLVAINSSTFSGFDQLVRLDLSTNRLEHIERGAFAPLSELSRLDLSWNRLTRLRTGVFDGLSSLGYLLLSGNSISTIDDDVFRPLSRLVYIVLRDNPLGDHVTNIQV